jgi:hypothetical protein
MPTFGLSSARAEASRRNGAKSRGPKTPEGKARSAQNALKHGLRSQKHVVLPGESAAEFEALEASLLEELAPQGALQAVLAARIARAAWRLERAERIEAELFERHADRERNLGLALIRDGNGARAFDTLLRYRGTTLAELWRALRLFKALQAEAAAQLKPAVAAEPPALPEPHEMPIEAESRGILRESKPVPAANEPARHPGGPAHAPAREPDPVPGVALARRQRCPQPNEPEGEATTGWAASLAPGGDRTVPARSASGCAAGSALEIDAVEIVATERVDLVTHNLLA